MGEDKTRERPTMGRIRELETKLMAARSERDRLQTECDEARAALEAVNTGDTPGYQVVPDGNALVDAVALQDVLDEMAEAGAQAAQRRATIRANRKASYGDRLQERFLEGTSKTAAYFLEKLSRAVER